MEPPLEPLEGVQPCASLMTSSRNVRGKFLWFKLLLLVTTALDADMRGPQV